MRKCTGNICGKSRFHWNLCEHFWRNLNFQNNFLFWRKENVFIDTFAALIFCTSCFSSKFTELEFSKSLWGLGTEEEEGYRTGPPGYIGWRNSFLGIDSGAPYMFKNTSSAADNHATIHWRDNSHPLTLWFVLIMPAHMWGWNLNNKKNIFFTTDHKSHAHTFS